MKKSILIVEDQAIVAMTIETQLVELGYGISGITATGEEAVSMAKNLHPDLILMDIDLAGQIDGIMATEQIKKFMDVPVIYLTAYSDDETMRRAVATDPASYMTKPFKIHDLMCNIKEALIQEKKVSG
jgi:CheY-like chemotaxis protein